MRRPNAKPETLASAAAGPTTTMAGPTRLHRRRRGGAVVVLAAATLAGALFLLSTTSNPKYSVVIDAGSTGSRVHVIAYRIAASHGRPPALDLGRTASMKASPGLSAFAANPRNAGQSLVELLEFAKRRIPSDRWGETEVRLMATAGLRLLDATVAERILESCREVLRGSGMRFRDEWASVISGADEGIYAWVAANYALGTLGGDPQDTTGIVELGGASAQVTFVTSEPLPPEFSHRLKFGEITYSLYSHSFLHLGQNVAYEALHDLLTSGELTSTSELIQQTMHRDPCTPRGFSHRAEAFKFSAGNFSECRSAAFSLLQKRTDKCMYANCLLGASFVPKLQGRFLATENFYHTSKFFGLDSKSLLSDLVLAGEQFCHEDWSKIKKKYCSLDEGDLLLYCFSSAYIVALLHDSLGISMDDKRIDFTNQVRGIPVDWALGAFIMQKTLNQTPEYSDWAPYISHDTLGLFSLLFVPTVLVLIACSILKWWRPYFKTICDMEKGRYIITSVSR